MPLRHHWESISHALTRKSANQPGKGRVKRPLARPGMERLESRLLLSAEFNGPLGGWQDVTQFGAVANDGIDDTAAIQAAINAAATGSPVVYIPSGTYQVTSELVFHQIDGQGNLVPSAGVRVIGEDPVNTTLVYEGVVGGNLFHVLDSRGWEISRLTLDGNNKAGILIYGDADGRGYYNGGNTITDDIFKNARIGIQGGHSPMNNIAVAEMTVERSQFINTTNGIFVNGFNSLDWWIWDSTFTNNHVAIGTVTTTTYPFTPGAGDIHATRNTFVGSGYSDFLLGNLAESVIESNFSTESNRFVEVYGPWTNAYNLSVKGNTVLDTVNRPIHFHNFTNLTLLDNTFRYNGTAVEFQKSWSNNVQVDAGQLLAVGNRYSYAGTGYMGGTRWVTLDEQIGADLSGISAAPPVPVPFLPLVTRPIVEVAGFTGGDIQSAIDTAVANYNGQHPVVHLPFGHYTVTQTLVVPANSDVQLIGDTADEARGTILWGWNQQGGTVLNLRGPSRATLKDMVVMGVPNNGYPYQNPMPADSMIADTVILVGNADQAGARVYANQFVTQSSTRDVGVLVDRIDNTHVELHNSQTDLRAVGGIQTAANGADGVQTALYSSAVTFNSGVDVQNGANVLLDGIYWEGVGQSTPVINLTDKGKLSVMSMKLGYYAGSANSNAVELHNFDGSATFLNTGMYFVDSAQSDRARILADGDRATQILLADSISRSATMPLVDNLTHPAAKAVAINNVISSSTGTASQLADQGTYDADWLRSMLADIRNTHPMQTPTTDLATGVTDVQLYQVRTYCGQVGLRVAGSTLAQLNFDESSGTAAYDSTFNHNDGTLSGGTLPTWTSGQLGGAIHFDGSANSSVVIPTSPELDSIGANNADFSLALWVKLDPGTTGYTDLIRKGTNAGNWTPTLQLTSQNNPVGIVNNTDYRYTLGAPSIPNDVWTHLAMVKTGNTLQMYVNGVLKTSATMPLPVVSTPGDFYLGDNPWNPAAAFSLDDVRIYNTALNTADVAALYNQAVLSVTNLTVNSPHGSGYSVQSNALSVGDNPYGDDSATFTSIPTQYLGSTYIQTANTDANSTGSNLVTFTVNQPVTVSILYNDAYGSLPAWMTSSGFTDTGDSIVTTLGTFNVFSKTLSAGTFILGGNTDDGLGTYGMYSILIAPVL